MIIQIFEGFIIDQSFFLNEQQIELLQLINSNITSGKYAEVECEKDGHHLQILSWKDPYEGITITADELEQAMDEVPFEHNIYEFIINRIED